MYKTIFILCFIFYFSINVSYAITPKEILEKVDDIRTPSKTFTFKLKVTVNKEGKKSAAGFSVRIKDAEKSLVLYESPPDNKGRVLLLVKNNMWIYIPGTRNPIRIAPQQQLMGDVSYADAARVVYSLDYNANIVKDDKLDGKEVLKITLERKTDGAAYKTINLWIEKNNYNPIKAEFYSITGKLLKTAYYKGYKEIFEKQIPTILELHDELKSSDITIMEYEEIKKEDTPDFYFQKTFMERVK